MAWSRIFPPQIIALSCLACLHGAQAAPADETAAYAQLVAELEAQQETAGVDAELSEAYFSLGSSLQDLQRHEEAVVAFDNALQVLRENRGLYDVAQLPLLQARLDSSEALAAWQDVEAGTQLAYLTMLRNPGAGIDLRYQSLRELGLWKLKAAEEELLPNALAGVRDTAQLYRQELERPGLRASYQGRPLSLANLYLDLAALEFLQARKKLALPLSEYVVGGPRTEMQTYCETIPTSDGRGRQVCRTLEVPSLGYFLSLSDRKYELIRDHLDAMQDAVLTAWAVLLPEVETQNRDDAVTLLIEVHRLTDAFNDFVAENARRSESRIAATTGSRINR
jgi:hypothetical protein